MNPGSSASSFLFVGLLAALTACGSSAASTGSNAQGTDPLHDAGGNADSGGHPDEAAGSPADGVILEDVAQPEAGRTPREDAASCSAIVQEHPIEGNLHMAPCSPLVYATNPPSSGNHYAFWAAYQTYTKPILPGFWVHSLEHGTVVISYNCDDGCPAEVARIQAFIDALPADCTGPPRRIILLPNPALDVRFAASAWGFTLKANCFAPSDFSAFVAAHYNHAPEDICSNGLDPLTAGTGGTALCP